MLGVVEVDDDEVAGLVRRYKVSPVPALHIASELLEIALLDVPRGTIELLQAVLALLCIVEVSGLDGLCKGVLEAQHEVLRELLVHLHRDLGYALRVQVGAAAGVTHVLTLRVG